jgi:cytochrome P450
VASALVGATLLRDPDQLERLRADRCLLSSTVEETLRSDAPVQLVSRRATRESALSDGLVPPAP